MVVDDTAKLIARFPLDQQSEEAMALASIGMGDYPRTLGVVGIFPRGISSPASCHLKWAKRGEGGLSIHLLESATLSKSKALTRCKKEH